VIGADARESSEFIEKLEYHTPITDDVCTHLLRIWEDPAIQKAWEMRTTYQCPYPVDYFISRLPEINKPGYVPSIEDVIKARVRTTGIVELNFTLFENKFVILDVGGQRNERKKWIHFFDKGVTAVIFVAAISEYDQRLVEDPDTNRVQEALGLFKEVLEQKMSENKPVILFLNKHDLFMEKIKTVHLNVCFPDYIGSMELEPAQTFIKEKFLSMCKNPSKTIHTHFTCATDTNAVGKVFESVRNIVINKELEKVDQLT